MKVSDTTAKVQKHYDSLWRKLSMEERFLKGLQWIQLNREFSLAGIRALHPHFTEEEIRKQLLHDLYPG